MNNLDFLSKTSTFSGFNGFVEREPSYLPSTEDYYQEMTQKKAFQEDPYTYIVEGLIKRGAGSCRSDDGVWEMAITNLQDFEIVVSDDFLLNFAEKKYKNEESHEVIMEKFKANLNNQEFRSYFSIGLQNNNEHHLAIALYIFNQSRRLKDFYTPLCASEE